MNLELSINQVRDGAEAVTFGDLRPQEGDNLLVLLGKLLKGGIATDAAAITPGDDQDLVDQWDLTATEARSLWVGGAGNVTVRTKGGTEVTFTGVPAGTQLPPLIVTAVRATGTTATNIVGIA